MHLRKGLAVPISHSNRAHGIVRTKSDFLWQVNGGPEKYQGGEECEVYAIVSVCTAGKNPTYLVRWAGYDSTYQTWEKADDIAPALLKAFHARIACPMRLEQPMHEMREAVAQVLMNCRLLLETLGEKANLEFLPR